MTKKKLIFIIVGIVLVLAIAASLTTYFILDSKTDIFNSRWGMDAEKVKSREKMELVNEEEYELVYKTDTFEGTYIQNTLLHFKFDGETKGLWKVSTIFETTGGFEDKLAVRIINAMINNYGENYEYEENSANRCYCWTTENSYVAVEQGETYLLVLYQDLERVEKVTAEKNETAE